MVLEDFSHFLFHTVSLWWFLIPIIAAFLLRKYVKGAQFGERKSCKGFVAVVTGCSGGIGKQVARELNYRGAHVHMLCRDRPRAVAAKEHLVQQGCDLTRLTIHDLDLASLSSVRKFASRFLAQHDKVDILVNNAGMMFYNKFELTEDGFELTWQTNYLGHFLLTELLLAALRAAPAGRVVNVSTVGHLFASKIDLAAVHTRAYFGVIRAYAQSKMAQVMQARELTRRLRLAGATSVSVNACHPGCVYTRLGRHTPVALPLVSSLVAPFFWFFLKTPKDGAQTPLFCALSSKLDNISGKYFSDCVLKAPSKLALDDVACKELYDRSLQWCQLERSAATHAPGE